MDEPPGPFKIPASPVTPLQQLSPDRVNQQRIPASPSMPIHLASADLKAPLQTIDVQSKVAFINSLNPPGSPSRQQGASTHAALQRALLGREEAENALRTANAQLADAEARQRKIGETLEGLKEELQSVRQRQAHERQVFEKEVRKAKKEAFRAGSALVKLQEDLKGSRAETKGIRAEAQHEKYEKEKAKQEAFERAYTLAGLLEEMEGMREKMRAMEAAREADLRELQASKLQQEEKSKPLAEKWHRQEDEYGASLSSEVGYVHGTDQTVQQRRNRFERIPPAESHHPEPGMISTGVFQPVLWTQRTPELGPGAGTDVQEQLHLIGAELQWEKKLRVRAEDMVHFLQMECQFKTCACRVAERNGKRFVHDKQYREPSPREVTKVGEQAQELEIQENHSDEPRAVAQARLRPDEDIFSISRRRDQEQAVPEQDGHQDPPTEFLTSRTHRFHSSSAGGLSSPSARMVSPQIGPFNSSVVDDASSPAIFSAEDMTYQSPIRTMVRPKSACAIPPRGSSISPPRRSPSASPYPLRPGLKTPQRPGLRIVHAHTTTMMVPLRDNDDVFRPAPGTPGTPVSREAALAQIRARRDRARSLTISTSKSAPGSARRGLTGSLRDISAPGRF